MPPFSPLRTNPYPLRAAIQLGCDNLATATAARIDVNVGGAGGGGALRDGLYHTEIPISQPRVIVRGGGASEEDHSSSAAFLDESSIHEATNALRKLVTGVRSVRALEVTVLLMPPFDRVANTQILMESWSRELNCQVRLFKDLNFKKQAMMHMMRCRRSEDEYMRIDDHDNNGKNSSSNYRQAQDSAKLNAIRRKRQLEKMSRKNMLGKELRVLDNDDDDDSSFLSPQKTAENFEWCWFMSHIVAAKNMAPHRALLIKETPIYTSMNSQQDDDEEALFNTSSLEIIGCDHKSNSSSTNDIELLRWSLPSSFSVPNAHRILYENIQRRPIELYKGHLQHVLNPMTRSEILQLVKFLGLMSTNNNENNNSKTSPEWILNRLEQDCVVTGSSSNGGLLNTCSRMVGNVNISLEKLEQANEFHYAGLSDTLLRQNYPFPTLVCAQAAVFSAISRYQFANRCRRVTYLPEVSVTHAMLTHPDLWTTNAIAAKMMKKKNSSSNLLGAPAQTTNAYPKQAIDKFDPNRVRW